MVSASAIAEQSMSALAVAVAVVFCVHARRVVQSAIPLLVGTKFDLFLGLPDADKADILKQARRFAHAMKAALVFCSASHSINIQKLFSLIISKGAHLFACSNFSLLQLICILYCFPVFNIACTVPQLTKLGEPIIEYQ